MADISQIKLPDNSTYDIKDSGALQLAGGTVTGPVTFSDAITATGGVSASSYIGSNSVEYIKSTQTGKTGSWTGVTKDTALYDGKMVLYALLQAPDSNASLNLTFPNGTTSGAKPIYRYGTTTRITTHYSQGSRILLVYNATNDCWNSSAWYYTGSDNKLALAQVTSGSTYYPIVATNSTSAATRQFDTTGFKYYSMNGAASSETPGDSMLVLGNNSAVGVANNKQGIIRLWGASDHNVQIYSGSPTEDQIATFPDKSGTIALTSDIPDVSSFITDPGVTKITTTVGAHTAITDATGAVSFNVPTKTSHLTNDSGFLTSDSTLNWNKVTQNRPTTISGYGITDAYTKTEVDNKVSSVLRYKGVKAAVSNLPTSDNVVGDVWHVTATSGEYAWDGTEWQELGTAITIPAATGSNTTGITVSDHSTTDIYGVSSSTTSVTGVSGSTSVYGVKSGTNSTTTASKASGANGTASSWTFEEVTIPNVTAAGSASSWTFEEKTIPNVTSAGSASSWTFEEKSIPNVTAAGSGSASLTFTMDTTDTKKLKIAFSHTHTAPTLGTAITVQSKSGGSNGTAPTLGTAIKVQSKSGGSNGSAPTLGTAIKVQSKSGGSNGSASTWSFTDVTVPIRADSATTVPTAASSATTVPIKNGTATTVVTSKTHGVTDTGHTHTI